MAEKHRIKTNNKRVFVSEDEKRVVQEKSNALGISVSEYLRKLIVNGYVFTNEKNKEIVHSLSVKINERGQKINDLARATNESKMTSWGDYENLMNELIEIRCLVEESIVRESEGGEE